MSMQQPLSVRGFDPMLWDALANVLARFQRLSVLGISDDVLPRSGMRTRHVPGYRFRYFALVLPLIRSHLLLSILRSRAFELLPAFGELSAASMRDARPVCQRLHDNRELRAERHSFFGCNPYGPDRLSDVLSKPDHF
jgi:hypothetical protein